MHTPVRALACLLRVAREVHLGTIRGDLTLWERGADGAQGDDVDDGRTKQAE
jgi:hypothetical protein